MMAYVEIVLGLVVAGLGFIEISQGPLAGGCELFVSGLLILTGIDNLPELGKGK